MINLFGKVNEKIGDFNIIVDIIQLFLRQEMVFYVINLFGRVNDKIVQKDQLFLKEEMVFIMIYLLGKVVKINDLFIIILNNDFYERKFC